MTMLSIAGIAIVMMTSSFFGVFMYEEFRDVWRRWLKSPALFQITTSDADGSPLRDRHSDSCQ